MGQCNRSIRDRFISEVTIGHHQQPEHVDAAAGG
jgi:hypothetical protein